MLGGCWPQADLDTPPPRPQDAKPLEVYSVDFMVDNAQLGFLGEHRAWGGFGVFQALGVAGLTPGALLPSV